jgi:hypothetical protein
MLGDIVLLLHEQAQSCADPIDETACELSGSFYPCWSELPCVQLYEVGDFWRREAGQMGRFSRILGSSLLVHTMVCIVLKNSRRLPWPENCQK